MAAAPNPKRQKVDNEDGQTSAAVNLKGLFTKDLITMMYGFGDDENPLPETVELTEELVIEYANGVLLKAMDIASTRGKAKPPLKGIGAVTAEDILTVVQKDRKKVDRVKELFDMQKEIREMRAVTDTREDMLDVDALKSLAKEIEND